MKRIILLLAFILAACSFAFGQTSFAEFEKAREIRLLQSNLAGVKAIFAGYEHDDDEDEDYRQWFSTENAEIKVTFSKGNCAEDSEAWDVAEFVVTKIEISPENDIKVKDFKFDFSGFTKEIEDKDEPEDYIYHDETSGIIFVVESGKIVKIILFPSKSSYPLLCDNEDTKELRSNETRLVDFILKSGMTGCVNLVPNVNELNLSAQEIIIGCASGAGDKGCSDTDAQISVDTVAADAENDVLTINYTISAGKINGQGAKVVWDLTGVAPGTYTITAGADDGAGILGATKTQTVVIKKCPDCAVTK
jgi:hypothetical protein